MVKETEFYERLGVSPDATTDEIHKAYRKMARKLHPDRNPGDQSAAEKFKALGEAYDTLGDEKKRRIYDRYGKKGLSHMDEMDFGPQRTEDSVNRFNVTLEDLYNGKKAHMAITRNVLCPLCHGNGTKSGKAPETCKACGGRGMKIEQRRSGMFIQQIQMVCSECHGRGEIVNSSDRCPRCEGRQVVSDRKVLELVIEPGMRDNQRITFAGESDQAPNMEPGDIIFVLSTKPHDRFRRKGDDLIMDRTITLAEALGGFEFTFEHLDKRQIVVKSPPETVVRPDDVLALPDLGMPIYNKPFSWGRMLVHFNVSFPLFKEIQPKLAELRACLPAPAGQPKLHLDGAPTPRDGQPKTETVVLQHYDPEADAQKRTSRGEAYDEDDEDEDGHPGMHRVQCAQQ